MARVHEAVPTEGHNGGKELTPTERSALRMHHVRQLLAIQSRMKPILEERKKQRATAKADGFKLSEIDAAMRLATMDDTSIFVDEIKELIEIAQAFNALPPGEQGTLFPDRRPVDDRCFDEGKVAGMEGKDPSPPYGANTSQGQAWMQGWGEGQRIMRDDLQAAMEKRNASKAEDDDEDADDEFDEAAGDEADADDFNDDIDDGDGLLPGDGDGDEDERASVH